MGVWIPWHWTPASIILRSSYSLFSFYGSLTDCPFRKFKRTRELYERNIITPRTDTNNNVNLYNHSSVQGVQWTGNVAVGSSYQIMKGQSLFFGHRRQRQTSKLITKCAVVFDTVFADTYLVGSGCSECENYNSDYYNFNSSATAVNYKQIITSTFFDLGYVSGYLIMDDLRLGDFQVSHSAYWSKEGLRSIPSIGSTKIRRGLERHLNPSIPKLLRERTFRFRIKRILFP